MALTAGQTTQVFEIFGIPQGGTAFVVANVTSLFGPAGEPYDFSTLVTALNAKLTALTTSQETRVTSLLTQWDTITSYQKIKITKGTSGAEGTLVDYDSQRAAIKAILSNIIGFVTPDGGFYAEVRGGSNRIER